MVLSKKDYKAIAQIIDGICVQRASYDDYNINRKELVEELSDYFKQENDFFDKDKFLKACGVEEE